MNQQLLSNEQYLQHLPPERRSEIERVWQAVRDSMPAGYPEEITAKYLTFKAGDEWYVALANQKNYISLYLTPLYLYPELNAKLEAAAKNLKCGKSCFNFRRAEELPLAVIGEIVGANGAVDYLKKVRSNAHHTTIT